jgi:uncharacterized DUF497 family protein
MAATLLAGAAGSKIGLTRLSPCLRTTRVAARSRNFCSTKNLNRRIFVLHLVVKITFDPAKRDASLAERGLDFADAAIVFAGDAYTVEDQRRAYGEHRFQTAGFLAGRMVMVVWTPRGDARHVISMRKCNEREKARYAAYFD